MLNELYKMAKSLLEEYKKNPNEINARSFDYTIQFIANFEGKKYGDIILKLKND